MRIGGRRAAVLIAVLLAVPVLVGVAWADPIGPDCGSCFGNIFTLTFDNLVNTPGPNTTLDLTLTIDTTNTTLSDTDVIRAVGVKVTSSTSDIVGTPTLTDAPGSTGSWTTLVG